jgi:3-oxoacyl-[acyl-carrier-protein] synthase-1
VQGMSNVGAPLFVTSVGATTPVGRSSLSSTAAVRAGISGFQEHPSVKSTRRRPIHVALAPWLDPGMTDLERFEALLVSAIDEALETHLPRPNWKLALKLALPAPRPGLPPDLLRLLTITLNTRYRDLFIGIDTLPYGHAAGLFALAEAHSTIENAKCDACLVAGVDSYAAPATLAWLEMTDALHGVGQPPNSWGLVPGEAAGALLLEPYEPRSRFPLQSLARVLRTGTAEEPCHAGTTAVCIGEGLTNAFHAALTGLPPGAKVANIYSDLNGEPFRADEYGFALSRTSAYFVNPTDCTAPADCWGDVGAATGPLLVILAMAACGKRYSKGQYSLLWTSSAEGSRAATLIQTQEPT